MCLIIIVPYVLFLTYWAKWSKSDRELRIIWSVNIIIPLHYNTLSRYTAAHKIDKMELYFSMIRNIKIFLFDMQY